MAPSLVLASTSRYRRQLLERLGVPFECVAPGVTEDSVDRAGSPGAVAAELARRKALAVAACRPDAVVIGSDQVCGFENEILGKPGTAALAREQLGRLAGRIHRLLTAVAVVHPGGVIEFVDETVLTMRALDTEEIRRYVAADDPVDCAGSYKLEARGITLFEEIASVDHTAVVGLPLIALTSALRGLGYQVP